MPGVTNPCLEEFEVFCVCWFLKDLEIDCAVSRKQAGLCQKGLRANGLKRFPTHQASGRLFLVLETQIQRSPLQRPSQARSGHGRPSGAIALALVARKTRWRQWNGRGQQ